MLFSAFQIGKIIYGYIKDRNTYIAVEEKVKKEDNKIDYATLAKINKDVVGWISCKDTIVDYPILQGGDNDYYLYRDVYEKYAGAGSIFMDFRNSKDFSDPITLIYGHHMKDGSMFNTVDDYQEAGFYGSHPVWTINTKKGDYSLKIFAGTVVKSNDVIYKVDYNNNIGKKERQAIIDRMVAVSDFKTDVKVSGSDRIVILSTCYPKAEDDRYVLLGKLVKKQK